MTDQDIKNQKLEDHKQALEAHHALLEKMHLNQNEHLDEARASVGKLALTLEEYLKIIGIP
ncbi:MAG: hypothetical protein WBP13_03075 [Methylophilaceae bacterium]